MQLTAVSVTKNSFGAYCIQGRDRDNYKKLLEPYKKKLDNLTKGYSVIIREERGPFGIQDIAGKSHYIYDIPTVTIIPDRNATRIVPQTRLYVYPEAGDVSTISRQAKQMLHIIKKGISLYR